MSKQIDALKLALEALEKADEIEFWNKQKQAIIAIKEALTQPQQEPVAYLCENATGHRYFRWKKPSGMYKPIALYTAPLQCRPLTDDQIYEMYNEPRSDAEMLEFARAIEAAHGIKENK